MSENKISTSVTEVSFDSVVAEFDKPATETKIPSIISNFDKPHPVFDQPVKTEPVIEPKKDELVLPGKAEIKDIDSVLDRKVEDEPEPDKPPGDILSAMQDMVKDESLFLFDEDKPLDKYTPEDIKELLKANLEHQKKEALNSEISEFFEALPEELQYAAKYVADGGTDLKTLFKALAATEEIKALDPKDLKDQEAIIREYYRSIDWGNDNEINEELDRIKELGETEVEKFANKYKPKLEKAHEELTKQHLARQERSRKSQEQEMNGYMENAHDAIMAGKIGEITLDKKTQASLWAGLTQPTYQTRRGATTNELGHLLEKYQYTEPNFEIIYEALWLLRDPKGYKEAIGKNAENKVVSNTARILKTEQGKKTVADTSSPQEDSTTSKKKTLNRPTPSFMAGIRQ